MSSSKNQGASNLREHFLNFRPGNLWTARLFWPSFGDPSELTKLNRHHSRATRKIAQALQELLLPVTQPWHRSVHTTLPTLLSKLQ